MNSNSEKYMLDMEIELDQAYLGKALSVLESREISYRIGSVLPEKDILVLKLYLDQADIVLLLNTLADFQVPYRLRSCQPMTEAKVETPPNYVPVPVWIYPPWYVPFYTQPYYTPNTPHLPDFTTTPTFIISNGSGSLDLAEPGVGTGVCDLPVTTLTLGSTAGTHSISKEWSFTSTSMSKPS